MRREPPGRALLDVLATVLVLLMIAQIFYQNLISLLFLWPVGIPLMKRLLRRHENERQRELTIQFKEMLQGMLTALKAGYSPENAFLEARQEMSFLYGKESRISWELDRLAGGMENHIPLETLIDEFAGRSGVEEIRDFSEVFTIARSGGGDMTEIMARTNALIRSRIEVENEIDLLLSSRRMEQIIMDAVPFFIIIYVGTASRGFFDVMYRNAAGIVIMTGCLIVYLFAFALSEKILDIRI